MTKQVRFDDNLYVKIIPNENKGRKFPKKGMIYCNLSNLLFSQLRHLFKSPLGL